MEKIYYGDNSSLLLMFAKTYMKKKYIYLFIIIILTILINLIQTIGISSIISNIINYINKNDTQKTFLNFNYFIGLSILYLFFIFLNKIMQSSFLANFIHNMRIDFFEYILTLNNIEMSTGNLSVVGNLINKISYNTYYAFHEFIDNFISNIIFIFIISIYLLYNDLKIGIIFLIGNITIIFCYLLSLPSLINNKIEYRDCNDSNENYIDDIYQNIEKIITSGTTSEEINKLKKMTNKCNSLISNYDKGLINTYLCIALLTYITICLILWYSINLKFKGKLNNSILITIITLILIYRERINKISESISEFIEYYVKIIFMENKFDSVVKKKITDPNNLLYKNKNKYVPVNLQFKTIKFENINFIYDDNNIVFKNFNNIFNTDKNKIIGITGKSGRGKSSLVKIIMKLYNNYDGNIYIDDINIREIDPTYIRNNITYIHQNGFLLDRLIIDNIMYGCVNKNLCEENLKIIMSYKNIKQIFDNINVYGSNGKLGQSLSGGQRQVINIINGLIKPTKILIIDEPTNALDPNLKKEVIDIIHRFKKYKQSIIIITHDKDVYNIIDEKIDI